MGWIIASLFFYYCAYLTIAEATGIGDEKPLVLLFFLVVATILLVVFIRKTVNSVREKRRDKEEEARIAQEKKAKEEREAKEKAERARIKEEQNERFCRGLATNPIITTAVPAVAVQCARKMVLKQTTQPYQNESFEIYASDNGIGVAGQSIPYAQYGLSSISDDYWRYELAKKAAEVFHQALRNELTALNTRYRTNVKWKSVDWESFHPEYRVNCEIGFADSRSW